MSLPKPKGLQKEVLYLPARGHCVVLGTAGSGKTTLAILRAAYLSRLNPAYNIMLVTFNKTLVTYLRSLSEGELSNVDVRTYHQFARGYLNSKGKMDSNSIADEDMRLIHVKEAIDWVKTQGIESRILKRPAVAFVEEIQWISRADISSQSEYVSTERIGRYESRILRKDRPVVWKVYKRYLSIRKESGRDYDWDDLAQSVCVELENDREARRYQHVVIDEGQDFSPVMLRSMALAIPNNGSLSFFGDMAQQIYGSRISWRSAGLNPPKIWYFQENYRNTKQVAKLGLAISNMPFFRGLPDLVEPKSPRADGPLPTLVQCTDRNKEIQLVAENAAEMGRTQVVAILNRNRNMDSFFKRLVSEKNPSVHVERLHRTMRTWRTNPGVYIGTYYSAKSLEFDAVLLPFCSEGILPDEERIVALGSVEEARSEEARLLYVAVTRAKTRLIITHSGNRTELLPQDSTLYRKVVA